MRKLYTRLVCAIAVAACLTPQPARAYEFEGGKLYGFALKTASYYQMPANTYYSFDLASPGAGTTLLSDYMPSQPTTAATVLNGKFVGICGTYTRTVATFDIVNNEWTIINNKNLSGCNYVTDMTELNGKVYGWIQPYLGAGWQLGEIDTETGAVTAIGSEQTERLVFITSDLSSKIYGLNASGKLYEISLTDSSLKEIGSVGMTTSTSVAQSATWDSSSESIIWVRYDDSSSFNTSSTVYAINPTTAKATSKGSLTNAPQLIGLYTPVSFNDKAPAQVTDLAASNDGISNDIKVTFTVPTKNYGGNDMAANISGLSYTIKVDGETKVDAKATTRDAAVTETITSTPGTHSVSVYVSQTMYGDGPESKCDVFVGMDTPGNVTDVVLKADGNDITLTWTAPKGVNGGKYDESKLTYTVTRMPDNVEVRTGLTETTFTETVSTDKLAPYSYKVTTVYDGTSTGLVTESNEAYVGPAFDITKENPYFNDFQNCTTAADAGFFCDSDTPMEYGEAKEKIAISITTDGDNKYLTLSQKDNLRTTSPKLFTTALRLKGHHTYKVSMKFKAGTHIGATFAVVMTDAPTAKGNIKKTIIESQSYGFYLEDSNWQNFTDTRVPTTEFSVDEDGIYYISLQGATLNNSWNIDDFKVEDVTAPGVPVSASDLKAVPATNGSRDITISFTLPTEDSNGDDPSLTKAELRRGNEVIKTWTENLAAGGKLEHTDFNSPLGFNSYSVVVSNANGSSPAVTTNAISGRDYDLKLQSVDAPESVVRGNNFNITATVLNNAANKAPLNEDTEYGVVLVRVLPDNSTEVVSVYPGVTLMPDESYEYVFTLSTGTTTPDELTYYINISFDADQYTDDNMGKPFTINFVNPEMPAVSNLNVVTTDGTDVLTWTAPEFDSPLLTLEGYDIYCNDSKVNAEIVKETTFTHTPADDVARTYYVIAIYNLGQSEASDSVNVGGTGIDSISADDNADAEYYTLKGIRIENPSAGGVYIRRQGNTVSKVVIL